MRYVEIPIEEAMKKCKKNAMISEVAEIRIWAAGSSEGAVSDFKLDETELS